MIYQNRKLLVILLLAIFPLALSAQQTLPVSGGEATGTGGTVSYTVGQTWYSTLTDVGGIITEGVQQPFEIYELGGVHAPQGIALQCIMYPNPVTDYVILKMDDYPINELTYCLYNMQGELLDKNKIVGSETFIQLSHLGSSSYVIRITDNQREIKAFKIIKK